MKEYIHGANPYMPFWEHVPDGEPRVFEYKGEKRVYLYGSHDTVKTEYCGPDQVVWSAPVDDLTNWKCHGVCYTATDGGILYAPDVSVNSSLNYSTHSPRILKGVISMFQGSSLFQSSVL